ncbi:MAG: twitch domain-containing radical SAM protein [Elusimicrobiota bacterium]
MLPKADPERNLLSSDVFCVAPWSQLSIGADGGVSTCCKAKSLIGDLKTSSIADVWNSAEMRAVRLDMLQGRKSAQCEECRLMQSAGGAPTHRQSLNEGFGRHAPLARTTLEDGRVPEVNLRFLHIRFSHACNFKCRICGPWLSTGWYEDSKIVYGADYTLELSRAARPNDLERTLEPWLADLEVIHFSGGEPLIMDEHYRVLDRLIARRQFHVKLLYSTNFSTMTHRGRDVMKLWDRFEDVRVSASLDGSGKRGEYLRAGQDWAQVVENRKRMFEACPRVEFSATPTLCAMNALHVPDFHREWLEKGYVPPDGFHLNVLQTPPEYSIQILPAPIKRRVAEKYLAHVEEVRAEFGEVAGRHARSVYATARHFLEARDQSDRLGEFRVRTAMLDLLRKERFEDVFPELAGLMG